MRVALIGATGLVGSKILEELLFRNHVVTAIVRDTNKVPSGPGVNSLRCDIMDTPALTRAIRGHECVIGAFSGKGQPDVYEGYLAAFRSVVEATRQAGVARLLMVGGAGSLQVSPGVDYVDTAAFPERARPGSLAVRAALELLRKGSGITWTMLSPSMFAPGSRTGEFRTGLDTLLTDAQGNSAISLEDYAVAFVNEIEEPRHLDRRFTVGY
ncbi:MAG: NAD(P)-dependent oxidoreductase [Burkholderiaceae bacterium]|nr:NAD(P)-dependent oxidoreductase [Burkholderiaceae bacterium]